MPAKRIHRLSRTLLFVFSLTALACVLAGYFQRPQPDEGALAHMFQISVMTLMLAALAFFFTGDWKRPLRLLQELRIPGAVLAAAFAALYFLERR